MLFKSQLMTQASGSLGGITASRNRGGMYFRARAIPTDPATAFQIAVRAFMTNAIGRWSSTLTIVQREDWEVYASLVTLPGPLGDPITVSGMNMYVRSTIVALQSGVAIVDDAPTIFNLGDAGEVSFSATEALNDIDVTFDNTADWAIADGGALNLFISRPQNPTINFFKGPFRKVNPILGAVIPPSSPDNQVIPFTIAEGQKLWLKISATHADGRLSAPSILGPIVVAA